MPGHGFRSARSPHLPSRREIFSARGAVCPAGGWIHVSRAAMARRFEITLPAAASASAGACATALDEVDRLEAQLSVFRNDSEVSRVNRTAHPGCSAIRAGTPLRWGRTWGCGPLPP